MIEPTLDMWTRESKPNNIVVNDPKGELLSKFYVPATYRGFQVIQFNLLNAQNTDICNPLVYASTAAREGDFTNAAMYVNNIAGVFFPVDGGEDPVWPNSANNAFKRVVYGMMDYYLEEEHELRLYAQRSKMDPGVLERRLDALWGKVTLYNAYQFFVQLTSKKLKNPATEFAKDVKAGKYDHLSTDEYNAMYDEISAKSELWEDKPEMDLMGLFFNATKALPTNSMRELVNNADDALRSMGGAEKMLASVYGIAITAMSFFTDPTIRTLTSGTPSQNADLAGFSFPRRIGFRMASDWVEQMHIRGMQAEWQGYEDPMFTKSMGKDFSHSDIINMTCWSRCLFKGIMPKETMYWKCEIQNPSTKQLIKTFYFKFTKGYQTTLNGRTYMKDPILDQKIVNGGVMVELRPHKGKDGKVDKYLPAHVTYKTKKIFDIASSPHVEEVRERVITQYMLNYTEKPKMLFMVTPPHLMQYAKLLLIIIKQLVDLNFGQSYTGKENQKPLYKTRYMLDELGNLQSEGHGIDGFETMLSIGLGQEQQFSATRCTLKRCAA